MAKREEVSVKNLPYSKNTKALVGTLLCGILYKLLMDGIVIMYLPSHYSTLPQYASVVSLWKLLLSYALLVPLLICCPQGVRAEALMTRIVLFALIIPMLSVFGGQNRNAFNILLVTVCYWLVEMLIGADISLHLQSRHAFNRIIYPMFAILAIGMAALLFRSYGLPSLGVLNFDNVYAVRGKHTMNKYLVYLFHMVFRVVMPFWIVVFLLRRQWIPLFVGIVLDLCFYLWTGNKTVLFSILLIIASSLVFRYKKSEQLVSWLFPLLWGVALLCQFLFERTGFRLFVWPLALSNRAFILPAMLKFFYFDFFLKSPVLGLYGTIIAPFLLGSAPYTKRPYPVEISVQYMDQVANANTGMFGGESAHFGIAGIFVAMGCFLLLLFVIRICRKKNGNMFAICISIYAVFSLTDSSAFSHFTSFDGILMLLVMMFYQFHDGTNTYKVKLNREGMKVYERSL